MIIPTFSRLQAVNKEGFFTDEMQNLFDVTFQQMQQALSNDGIEVPQLPTASINQIASASNANAKPNGTIWYDSNTNQFKGKINGAVKVFTLT
jgi:hypothetical protein